MVVWCTCHTQRAFPNGAGRWQLTGAVLVSTAAAAELLGERAELVVLRAIQERLEMTQPVGLRPVQEREGKQKKEKSVVERE